MTPRVQAAARVVLADGAAAQVRARIPGILEGAEDGSWPRRGDRVQAGQMLGAVIAPLDAATQAQLHAFRLELELDGLAAEQRLEVGTARLRLAEAAAARTRRLTAEELRSPQQLEVAEQELLLARQETAAAAAALEALAAVRSAPAAGTTTLRMPLTAPITGIVEEAPRALGEFVEPQDLLLGIVDPSRRWVEASVSEFDLARIAPEFGGELVLDAWPDRIHALTPSSGARWLTTSPRLDPASRTATLVFDLPTGFSEPQPGMRGVLRLAAAPPREVLTVPASALIWEAGVPTAYVLLAGETMQRRLLTLGDREGDVVEVRSGLQAGERVVTRGAYAVRLASLAPTAFGEGHAH